MYAFLNDRFVSLNEATVPVSDLAINRGYGVFDYCKTLGDKPVFINDHLDRFYRSAASLRLPLALDRDELKTVLKELIARNGTGNSGIRLTLTGGASADGYSIATPHLIITQQPLTAPAASVVAKGIRLLSLEYQRQLPDVKTIDYLTPIWLQPRLLENNADDFVYHTAGNVSESPRANVFAVMGNGKIVTPKAAILPGITRSKLIQLAVPFYSVEEGTLTLNDLANATEIWVTSTTKGVLPVAAVDGKQIGGKERPVSTHLAELLQKAMHQSIND